MPGAMWQSSSKRLFRSCPVPHVSRFIEERVITTSVAARAALKARVGKAAPIMSRCVAELCVAAAAPAAAKKDAHPGSGYHPSCPA